jgi:hypothetical protein
MLALQKTSKAYEKEKYVPTSENLRLVVPQGIEHTVMCPREVDKWHGGAHLVDAYDNALDNAGVERFHGPKFDGERAVETPSNPLDRLWEIEEWYHRVTAIAKLVGFTPHDPNMISGGGHIHASYTVQMALKAFRDVVSRPYLLWVFNDPNDKGCKLFNEAIEKIDKEVIEAVAALPDNLKLDKVFDSGSVTESFRRAVMYYGKNLTLVKERWLFDDKGYMVRWVPEHKTLEFRFFDAPLDWPEQKSHVLFVDAYTRWIMDQPLRPTTQIKPIAIRKYTEDQAIGEFQAFCEELKLDSAMFDSQIARNVKGWVSGQGNFGLVRIPPSRGRRVSAVVVEEDGEETLVA